MWYSYIPGTQLLGTFNVRIFLAMMEEDAREPTRESLLLEILWDHIATTVLQGTNFPFDIATTSNIFIE